MKFTIEYLNQKGGSEIPKTEKKRLDRENELIKTKEEIKKLEEYAKLTDEQKKEQTALKRNELIKKNINENKENYIFIQCSNEKCEQLKNMDSEDLNSKKFKNILVKKITFKNEFDKNENMKRVVSANVDKKHIENLIKEIEKIFNELDKAYQNTDDANEKPVIKDQLVKLNDLYDYLKDANLKHYKSILSKKQREERKKKWEENRKKHEDRKKNHQERMKKLNESTKYAK